MQKIFIVSDGTGGTAKRALRAALTQFEGARVELVERPEIRNRSQVEDVVKEALHQKGFIIHTLVSDTVRDGMLQIGREYNVSTFDLMGPLLERLSQKLAISPSMKPGLFGQLNEAYFRRIETIEFAFGHDDGQKTHELEKAEIILVGVSRTFKTPLSIYLAIKGWCVANVPIVLDLPLPDILNELRNIRIVGLKSDPFRLAELRKVREAYLSGATGEYARPDYVQREMRYALKIFSEHPRWPVIDVTGKPIEEIASEIITLSASKST